MFIWRNPNPAVVTLSGMTMEENAEPSNAWPPIVVRCGGRVIEVRSVVLRNADSPIVVTLFGKEIEVIAASLNAALPIEVAELSIVTAPVHPIFPVTIPSLIEYVPEVPHEKVASTADACCSATEEAPTIAEMATTHLVTLRRNERRGVCCDMASSFERYCNAILQCQ